MEFCLFNSFQVFLVCHFDFEIFSKNRFGFGNNNHHEISSLPRSEYPKMSIIPITDMSPKGVTPKPPPEYENDISVMPHSQIPFDKLTDVMIEERDDWIASENIKIKKVFALDYRTFAISQKDNLLLVFGSNGNCICGFPAEIKTIKTPMISSFSTNAATKDLVISKIVGGKSFDLIIVFVLPSKFHLNLKKKI